MRRVLIIMGAVVAAALVVLIGWDFAQFGRRAPPPAAPDARATTILVEKQSRRMTLLHNRTPIKSYAISLGGSPVGQKRQEGDGRTPEGAYKIDFKNQHSRFHLALRISYPEPADRDQAKARGVSPGGDIMIHGLPNGLGWLQKFHLWHDWTDGCIAVTNSEVEEIWSMVDVGTAVEIKP